MCGIRFVGNVNKETCSAACGARLRKNDTYFGGRMMFAEGWEKKDCQVCGKIVKRGYHIHHVYGYPDHSRLVILCAGCHDVISRLAQRSNFGAEQFKSLIDFALLQRRGHEQRKIL